MIPLTERGIGGTQRKR